MKELYYSTKFSHADFSEMMKEKILDNKSVEDLLCIQLEKVK